MHSAISIILTRATQSNINTNERVKTYLQLIQRLQTGNKSKGLDIQGKRWTPTLKNKTKTHTVPDRQCYHNNSPSFTHTHRQTYSQIYSTLNHQFERCIITAGATTYRWRSNLAYPSVRDKWANFGDVCNRVFEFLGCGLKYRSFRRS